MRKRFIKTAIPWLIISIIIGGAGTACAQKTKERYRAVNRTISLNNKLGSVHLDEVDSVGIAWILNTKFTEGVIEFDVKGNDKFQGSFVGIAFHGLNDTTYESIYFRPFNFRATDPLRKAHAVQYLSNPKYDWPRLRADFPGKYEKPVSPHIDPNQWFHVKIVVSQDLVTVYMTGNDHPVLEVRSLTLTKGKMIGYWAGNGSGGDWRNLKITSK